ncbi:MAG TPA: aminotransferase class I/II-fold pyridoxal phosphate-dependent enzyme [Candidatus Blautia avistercoris]|nr:aminotransferase class I/II-fold pyridoxal phosphate-dependent enzyme [Candidatus Blautia avistercoris]
MESLYDKLKEYSQKENYPFHMPGHKRNPESMNMENCGEFIDITEIHGFDNLHHSEGILRAAQERAARLFHVRETFYSINGSTGALLAAVSAAVKPGGRILIARNCHKAVYHAAAIRRLKVSYIYPQVEKTFGINGGILPEDVDKILDQQPEIEAVVITSPTYDGMVSHVKKIAEIVHTHKKVLIVDEAHGAHFSFSDQFPDSAVLSGADLVIQSLHKTLPSFTQTAVLHRNSERVNREKLQKFMEIYQSSSPSYLLMASMDSCICDLMEHGKEKFAAYVRLIQETRKKLSGLKRLHLITKTDVVNKAAVADMDISKFVISVKGVSITGKELSRLLRENYHLEMEMEAENYVLALSSVGDRKEGMDRLVHALLEIDSRLERKEKEYFYEFRRENSLMEIGEAMESPSERIPLLESQGEISGEFVYLYPPGIPLLVPGEKISLQFLRDMRRYKKLGFQLEGLSDFKNETIRVVKEGLET